MPNASTAELYFIAVMMILMLVFSVVSIYFFIRTYKKEMREKEARKKAAAEKLKNQTVIDEQPANLESSN